MTKFADVKRLPEFERDLKKMLKHFSTLEDDLQVFIGKQLVLYHHLKQDNGGIVQISGLGFTEPKIYKARKFACKALKGRGAQTGIRVIYTYSPAENVVELIEIYFKGDKENEHRERILQHFRA